MDETQCHGKLRYANRGAALEVLRRIAKRDRRRIKERYDGRKSSEPYACRACGGWHVGRKGGAK